MTIEHNFEDYTSAVIVNFHFSAYVNIDSGVHFYIWIDDVVPTSSFYRISSNASSMNVEESILKVFPDVESGTHQFKIGFLGYHTENYIFDRQLDIIIIPQEN